eukprot:2325650-Amphidinium_carterae.1
MPGTAGLMVVNRLARLGGKNGIFFDTGMQHHYHWLDVLPACSKDVPPLQTHPNLRMADFTPDNFLCWTNPGYWDDDPTPVFVEFTQHRGHITSASRGNLPGILSQLHGHHAGKIRFL